MAVNKTLCIKFNIENTLKHYPDDSIQDSYEAEKLIAGLFVGKKRDAYNDGRMFQNVYSIEIGYGGGKELMWVGTLDHSEKKYNFTHGYFPPHKTGKKFRKWAISQDFEMR